MPKKPVSGPEAPAAPGPASEPTPAPAPAAPPAGAARDQAPRAQITPVAKKIGEGPGNLKAREAAFKRRTGLR